MTIQLSRRDSLRVAALAAASPALLATNALSAHAAPGTATPVSSPGELVHRAINYDVGTQVSPEFWTRPEPHRAYLESELAAIRDDLHCTTVAIFGGDPARLIEGATAALDAGLHVRLQPRLVDAPVEEVLAMVTDVAGQAEALRSGEHEIVFDIGCELTLLGAGIIPGATFAERFAHFMEHLDDLPAYSEQLNEVLAQALPAAREVFGGRVTYASGAWEAVTWDEFDIVSVDLYRDYTNQDGYVDVLRSYHQHDKPVWITEFGCCAYEGAAELGGSGFDIVDWTATPPQITGEHTRSETVQAEYIGELLDLFAAEGVDGAFVYQFIEPHLPTNDDPQFDLDMASYGVVKTFPADSDRAYDSTGTWEPKEAFAAIAERYGTATATPAATPIAPG